jgi:hypothetical protein
MIYYVVLAILVALALPVSKSTRNARAALAVLLLLGLGGLRHEVGTDWFAYEMLFNSINMGEPFSTFREENGFLALAQSVATLGGGFPTFVFMAFALALGTKIWAVRLFGVNLNAALLIYFSAIFLIYDINGLRQGLAMGFVMLAGWAAYRGQILPFLSVMAAAASMHMFALIALPIWVFTKRWLFLNDRLMRVILLLGGCVGCYAAAGWIANSNLSSILALLNLVDRYDYYVDQFDTIFNPLGPGSLQRILVALVIALMIDDAKAPARLKAILYNTHAAALFMYFLLSFNMELMARLSFYYKCMDIVTLSLIFGAQSTLLSRWLFIAFLATLCFAQIFQILSIPDGGLRPYNLVLLR